MERRRIVLFAGLAVSALLVGWDQWSSPAQSMVVAPAARRAATPPTGNAVYRRPAGGSQEGRNAQEARAAAGQDELVEIAEIRPRQRVPTSAQSGVDPFESIIPKPEPPKPIVNAPPPVPIAPPLPFTYMGRKQEAGEWTIYLARQDKTYVVHKNDVIDGEYRVVAINPAAMEFEYLPLKEKQNLDLGGSL